MKEIIFVTHNANKTREISALLDGQISVYSLDEIGYREDIIENGISLEENATVKAKTIYDLTKRNCFADDTGLFVEALNGDPGVYSARYAGDQKDSNLNMDKLLRELAGKENRKAKFITLICLIFHSDIYYFEGQLSGVINRKKMGRSGFGYDPVFVPDGFSKTLAELNLEEKNKISHRAKAFLAMKNFLLEKANL